LVGATNGTVTANSTFVSSGGNSVVVVTVGGVGLPAAIYSVCLDLVANSVVGGFAQVGSSSLLVGALWVSFGVA
jgi:hypothetical protein